MPSVLPVCQHAHAWQGIVSVPRVPIKARTRGHAPSRIPADLVDQSAGTLNAFPLCAMRVVLIQVVPSKKIPRTALQRVPEHIEAGFEADGDAGGD